MPNTKSAIRADRLGERRHARGKTIRSQTKTTITKAEKLIFSGQADTAKGVVSAAISGLDKAAGRKIIHPKNAARRKSRLMKKLNKAAAAAATAPKAETKLETKETK